MTQGEKLKDLRKLKGLTQAQLATLCQTTQANISNAENNTRPIGLYMAKKLAQALGVHFVTLLDCDHEPKRNINA